MKKFFGNIYIFVSLLLISLVAIPWNDFSVWGLDFSFLSTLKENEFLIKNNVLSFIFIFSLIFLFVSNREYKKTNKVSRISAYAVLVPLMGYVIAFVSHLTYMIYTDTDLSEGIGISNLNSLYLIAGAAIILLTLIFSHIFIRSYRARGNAGRIVYFVIFTLLSALFAALAYLYKTYEAIDYNGMSAKYMALVVPLVMVLYIIHIIIIVKNKEISEFDTYDNYDNLENAMVSGDNDISFKSNKIEPNENLYQAVKVDPEFSKQNKLRNKPNSIEYYIEKPKMFKPLNPTFDKLVQHVKEFPDVITKMDEEKITFYVARLPFLVLMNYGDYYRIAFRYELEEGIRLIIKYPTISKNKSTREELWFKANNYGDLPKEIIYKIVKNAYDLVSR
ncbi:hypothetical protein KHQ88_02905 [Mycoplasmatota bacterium]|nr:hypothetical protein KHQ88_02905 [Mycoplasmatota bacterium]